MGLLDRFFGPPSRDRFGRMVLAALKKAGEPGKLTYESEQFRILIHDETGRRIGESNLVNVYREYCEKPKAQRRDFFSTVVRASLARHKEVPEEFDDAKPDILPVVRSRSFHGLNKLRSPMPDLPIQIIGDHLLVMAAYDLPEAMSFLSQDRLDDWGTSLDEVLEIALHNLERLPFAFAEIGTSLYASLTGDNYDASRLLLLDVIRKLEVRGDHIAMVPHRDSLLITGSDEVDGLGLMAKFAEDSFQHPRHISCTALRLDGDDWVPWMPPEDHPHFAQFRLLEVRSVYNDYDQQKQLLDEQGSGLYVAKYSAGEDSSGTVFSYAAWSDGVPTLLPKTNKLFLVRGADVLAGGEWEQVQAVVGHLMQPTDMYPLRCRVTEFPTAEQLAAIGNELT
jgi:uncharacterized protein YtpQ (UPF0354 family)